MNKDVSKFIHTPLSNGKRQTVVIRVNDEYAYRGIIKDGDNTYQSTFLGNVNLLSHIKNFNMKRTSSVDADLQRKAISFSLSR